MFAEEKPSLLPLPIEPFRYYQYGERVVHLSMATSKSRPPTTAPRRAGLDEWERCSGARCTSLLDPKTGQLLREHVRQKRGWYRIKEEEDRAKRTPLRTS